MDEKLLKKFNVPAYVSEALLIEGYSDLASFKCIRNPEKFIQDVTSTVRNYRPQNLIS
jgi:hypothetical protein